MSPQEKLIRTVRFPLKAKLIVIFMLLLAGSLSFYVYFALDLFSKDKSAYIYENGLASAESLSHRVHNFYNHSLSNLSLMASLEAKGKLNEDLLKNSNSLLQLTIYQNEGTKREFYNSKELGLYNSSSNEFKKFVAQNKINPGSVNDKQVYAKSFFESNVPHLLLALKDQVSSKVYVGRFIIADIQQAFNDNKIYNSYLMGANGEVLFGKQSTDDSFVLEVLSSQIESGVREIEKEGETILVAFQKNPTYLFTTFSEIEKSKAFAAAKFLEQKSLWFGLFVLSIAIIIAILFSRRITQHLNKLYQATEKIAQGDFSTQVEVTAHDEVGALSDSFNYMGREIVRYISEMEEKARLENELKVAKLVQDQFFPESDIKLTNSEISAFYTPASECGGDWWGYITVGNKTLIAIIDATGHGVPAALLTATAHCCFENLKTLSKVNPALIDSPIQVISFMNKAVCGVGSEILMTAFVALIDSDNKKITYANASHNPPFLYDYQNAEADKSHLKPLLDSKGPRLGQEKDATYTQGEIQYKSGDSLILFTDGIIEGVNPEGKEYGQRKFLKSLLANVKKDAKSARDAIIEDAFNFYDGKKNDDDITLVMNKFN
jgi:sigma-B regulation protein RsbU (phosphoserine phosphatase)